MVWYFVLKICIIISLLGYNLVFNDKKMHFTFLCNEPLRNQNVKPTYFCKNPVFVFIPKHIFKEKFHTPTKVHHFVSTPIQISSAPTLVILNDHSLRCQKWDVISIPDSDFNCCTALGKSLWACLDGDRVTLFLGSVCCPLTKKTHSSINDCLLLWRSLGPRSRDPTFCKRPLSLGLLFT